ncbi:uncharacterized protein METZ01_LOCUS409474, partial [marine metagenome]
ARRDLIREGLLDLMPREREAEIFRRLSEREKGVEDDHPSPAGPSRLPELDNFVESFLSLDERIGMSLVDVDPSPAGPSRVDINIRAEGESLIEQAVGLEGKLEVIRSLVGKNDQEARLELACGLRDPSVRAPLKDAMERIGWRSFLPLLEDVSGVFSRRGDDWPSEFSDWMEEKKREAEQKKRNPNSPHDFRDDDYGIEDT